MYWVTPTVTKEESPASAYIFVESNDTDTISANGNADEQTEFLAVNGRCSYPSENRNNSIAVAENRTLRVQPGNTMTITYFQHKITAVEAYPTTDTKIKSDIPGFNDLYTIYSNTTLTHDYGDTYGESEWFSVSPDDFREYPSEIETIKTVPVSLDSNYNRTEICSVVIA